MAQPEARISKNFLKLDLVANRTHRTAYNRWVDAVTSGGLDLLRASRKWRSVGALADADMPFFSG